MKLEYEKCFDKKGFEIEGPLLISPKVYLDERGFFHESWNKKDFSNILLQNNQKEDSFVQDNHSKSTEGTLRGIHYQKEPYAQGKLIRCISGKIFDIALDLRKNSETFLNYTSVILSSENHYQLWIPKGFGHGFLTLSENTQVLYKTTNYWNKDSERGIKWNDPEINISWPLESLEVSLNISEKDLNSSYLKDIKNEDFF